MENMISLCMIVRDEAGNLARCLRSAAQVVDEIIVVDTGSTDQTRSIAESCGAIVRFVPWTGSFSAARNASLELAGGNWILFLDADEELTETGYDSLHALITAAEVEGYFCKIINYIGNQAHPETSPDLVFRLFRHQPGYRFRGAVHEQIADVILELNPAAAFRIAGAPVIRHYGYLDNQIQQKDKKNRNLNLIENELAEKPDNRSLRYHYGVELFRLERYAEAAKALRAAADGIDPHTVYLPKLFRYVVMCYYNTGDRGQALTIARQGLQYFPDYADLYYYCGLIQLDQKQYGAARECFVYTLSLPEQPPHYASFAGTRGFRSHFHLGQIAAAFLDEEAALGHYINSLRDNPDFLPALERIVEVLNPGLHPAYTRECLEKICDFASAAALQEIAGICFRQGGYELAWHYWEKSATTPSLPAELQLCQAICLIQTRRYDEGLKLLADFAPDNPFYPVAKLNTFFTAWHRGDQPVVHTLAAELQNSGLTPETQAVVTLLTDCLAWPDEGKPAPAPIMLEQDSLPLLQEIIKRLLALGKMDQISLILSKVNAIIRAPVLLDLAQKFQTYGHMGETGKLAEQYLAMVEQGLVEQNHSELALAHYLLAEIKRESLDFPSGYAGAEDHYRQASAHDPDNPRYYLRQLSLYEEWRVKLWEKVGGFHAPNNYAGHDRPQ